MGQRCMPSARQDFFQPGPIKAMTSLSLSIASPQERGSSQWLDPTAPHKAGQGMGTHDGTIGPSPEKQKR